MIDRLTAICLLASVCLAAALPLELSSHVTEPLSPSIVAKPDVKHAIVSDVPAVGPLVATALARPLFSPTRRPPESEQDGHSDTSLNDLRLTGILTMPDQRFAIFVGSDGKPLVRSKGEMIGVWRIENVAAQSLLLSGPSGTTTLEPKADPNLVRLQSIAQPAASASPRAASPPPPPAPRAPARPAPALRPERD